MLWKYPRTIKPAHTFTTYNGRNMISSFTGSTSFGRPEEFPKAIVYLDGFGATTSNWSDTSGSGNSATLYNSPSVSSGVLLFNGTNQYGAIGSGFADFTGGMTVLSFVNFNGVSNWERIIDFGNGPASNNFLMAREGTTDNFAFEIYLGSTSAGKVTISGGITNNGWGFYGARLNGTNANVFNQSTFNTTSYSTLPNNIARNNNYIGRSNWSADAYFDGNMGFIGIWDQVLTEFQIVSLYNKYRGRYGLNPLSWT